MLDYHLRLSPILQPTVKEISELLLTKYVKKEKNQEIHLLLKHILFLQTIKQTSRILKIMNIVVSIIHTKANNKFVS